VSTRVKTSNPRYGIRPDLTTKEAFATRPDTDPNGPPGIWRRDTPPSDDDAMDITHVIHSVFSNPDLYAAADAVPPRSKLKPGCPADYPNWALTGYGALLSAYGSSRAAHTALQVERNWAYVLETVAAVCGQETVDALREKAKTHGPTRNHWNYWSKVNKKHWDTVQETLVPLFVKQAQEQGLLDPTGKVSYTSPNQANTIYGDGKVMTGPTRPRKGVTFDSETGEWLHQGKPVRHDPASSLWAEGGDDGEDAYGTKFVFTSVRGTGFYNKVNLVMGKQVEGGATEAQHCLAHARRVMELAGAGVHAIAWDGALSSVHIDELMREHGLVVASPVKAKRNPDNVRSGKKAPSRVEKERDYGTHTERGHAGPCQHKLRLLGGRLGEVLVDNTGKETWVPIQIDKLTRTGKPGAYRWYHELTIACPTNDEHTPACLQNRCLGDHDGCTLGGHPYRLPLVQTQADTDADFRRSEYARQLPPDTQGYARTFGRRPPAESDNAQREQRYTWKRIPATAMTSRASSCSSGACWRTARADGTTSGSTHTTRPPPDQHHTNSTTQRVTTTPGHPETHPGVGPSAARPLPRQGQRQAY